MNSSALRSRPSAALAATCMLIAGVTALGAGDDFTLQVQGVAKAGQSVQITVLNPGDKTITGTVRVTVAVKGRVMMASRTVTVPEGQKAFVAVDFPAPVDEIIEAGVILDDGSPF